MSHPLDKVVVLAAGLGTRMRRTDDTVTLSAQQREAAEAGVKAMVPIERPFLDYVLHEVAAAGYKRVCLVIGPEHDHVRDYYLHHCGASQLTFDFAIQHDRRGTADAVATTQAFVGDDDFLMINSDNHYPRAALAALRELDGPGVAVFDRKAMIQRSNIPADRIAAFAVVQTDGDRLTRIVEKPSPDILARLGEHAGLSMNCWRFSPAIFHAAATIKPSPRGELEITDAVQKLVDEGHVFRVVRCDEPVLDLSKRSDIPAVAQRLAGSECRL